MCAGYYKLMVAAKQEKKIMIPNSQFDNEIVRYEHRFGAFANLLTPPLMPYTQFKVSVFCLNLHTPHLRISKWNLNQNASLYFNFAQVCLRWSCKLLWLGSVGTYRESKY